MKLPDRLHCPNCKGRLCTLSADTLQCANCERTVQFVDGIADFVGDSLTLDPNSDRYHGAPRVLGVGGIGLLTRILTAAGARWPASLGDTIEFGCGLGETTYAIAASQNIRSLIVFDTRIEMLQACRTRLAPISGTDRPITYATLSGARDVIRDAVADTAFGTGLMSGIGDVRGFLAMVLRVLRPGGRAVFVVPNRRYHEAMSLAMAQALVHRRASDGAWPQGQEAVLEVLASTRRLLVLRDDLGHLADLEEKHLFNAEELQDLGREVGFAKAEMIPLDPDAVGTKTMRQSCHDAGAQGSFAETFGTFAAAVGKPYFNLLGRQDSSASMLLWLRKASGPDVRIFAPQPAPPRLGFIAPESALGGAPPRWSVELLARDTPDGILLSVGGWCLCNSDVRWIRMTLDGVTADALVWRPRPDVHDVINRSGLYNPLNTLCSGMADEILFEGAHATDETCAFRMEVVLTSGFVVTGPAPDVLAMNEPTVISH